MSFAATIPEGAVPINQFARDVGVDVSTVWRWTTKGVRGHVLHAWVKGGRRFITPADWRQFDSALNSPTRGPAPAPASKARQSTRRAEIASARRELHSAGIVR